MKNKILVMVYVPIIESEFDLYIPTVKKIGAIKSMILSIVEDASDKTFVNDGYKYLYDKLSGEKLDDNQFVKNSGIKNGTKLILY